jgi:hypothetical protein
MRANIAHQGSDACCLHAGNAGNSENRWWLALPPSSATTSSTPRVLAVRKESAWARMEAFTEQGSVLPVLSVLASRPQSFDQKLPPLKLNGWTQP